MSRDEDKLIRQLSLLSFLLSKTRPFTAREIQESVEGYSEMSDDTFTRRFHGDRADLAKIGHRDQGADRGRRGRRRRGATLPTQGGGLSSARGRLHSAELTALSMALAALDGRFAYARPLRLASDRDLPRPSGRSSPGSSICFRSPWRPTRMPAKPVSNWPAWRTPWPEAGRCRSRTLGRPRRRPHGAHGRSVQPVLHPRALVRRRPGSHPPGGADLPGDADSRARCASLTEKSRDFYVPADYDPGDLPRPAPLAARTCHGFRHHKRRRRPRLVRRAAGSPRLAARRGGRCLRPVPHSLRRSPTCSSPGWSALAVAASCSSRPSSALGCWRPSTGAHARTPEGPPALTPAGCRREPAPAQTGARRRRRSRPGEQARVAPGNGRGDSSPSLPEHLARAVALLHYLGGAGAASADPLGGRGARPGA